MLPRISAGVLIALLIVLEVMDMLASSAPTTPTSFDLTQVRSRNELTPVSCMLESARGMPSWRNMFPYAEAADPPKVLVRYNQSFLDWPDGYFQYRYRTQIIYEYMTILSGFQLNFSLPFMAQIDGVIRIVIRHCYIDYGLSLRIQAWGDGTSTYAVPVHFSRPVQIIFSNNVIRNTHREPAVHIVGILPLRSTIYIADNTYEQNTTTAMSQAFVILEALHLMHKSRLTISGNSIVCSLPTQPVDSSSTCNGVIFRQGFRLSESSIATVTNNLFVLSSKYCNAISIDDGTPLSITQLSSVIISKNLFDIASIPKALFPSVVPWADYRRAVGVSLAVSSVSITAYSSFVIADNTFDFSSQKSELNVGIYIRHPTTTGTMTVQQGSMFLIDGGVVDMLGEGSLGLDSFIYLDASISLSVASFSAVVVRGVAMTSTVPPTGLVSKSFVGLGSVTTLANNAALWITQNSADFGTPLVGGSTSVFYFLNAAKVVNLVSGAGTFAISRNVATNVGTFLNGGLSGPNAPGATVAAVSAKCNYANLALVGAGMISLFTVTAGWTNLCAAVVCIPNADCFFAPYTQGTTVTGTGCQCSCATTAIVGATQPYGEQCLPAGVPMSFPLFYTLTDTGTESESRSNSTTPSISQSEELDATMTPTNEISQSASQSSSKSPSESTSNSASNSDSPSITESPSSSDSASPSKTMTGTESVTFSVESSQSRTRSEELSASRSASISLSMELSASRSYSWSLSDTDELTATMSWTTSASASNSASESLSISMSGSSSDTLSLSQALSSTVTFTPEETLTETFTKSPTGSFNQSKTNSTSRPSRTETSDKTLTATPETDTKEETASWSKTPTDTVSFLPTGSNRTLSLSPSKSISSSMSEEPSSTVPSKDASSSKSMSMFQSESASGATRSSVSRSRSVGSVAHSTSASGSDSQSAEDTRTVSLTTVASSSSTETVNMTISVTESGTTEDTVSGTATQSGSFTLSRSFDLLITNTTVLTMTLTPSLTESNSSSETLATASGMLTLTFPRSRTNPNSSTVSEMRTISVSATPRSKTRAFTRSRSVELTSTMTITALETLSNITKSFTATLKSSRSPSRNATITGTVTTSVNVTPTRGTLEVSKNSKSIFLSVSKTVNMTISATEVHTNTSVITKSASITSSRTPDARTMSETLTLTRFSPSRTASNSVRSISFPFTYTVVMSETRSRSTQRSHTVKTLTEESTGTFSVTDVVTLSRSATQSRLSFSMQRSAGLSLTSEATITVSKTETIRSKVFAVDAIHVKRGQGITRSVSRDTQTLSMTEGFSRTDTRSLTIGTPLLSPSKSQLVLSLSQTETSDETMSGSVTLTPPPTPTKTVTITPLKADAGLFLSHLNIFFITSIHMNGCYWMVTYLLGPLLLVALVTLFLISLWRCGVFYCMCSRKIRVDAHGDVSVARSLFTLSVYGSVFYPCHGECWALHILYLVLHLILIAMLYFGLPVLMATEDVFTQGAGFKVQNGVMYVALIIVVILCAVHLAARPLFQKAAFYFRWEPERMEQAWKKYARESGDPDLVASSDEETEAEIALKQKKEQEAVDAERQRRMEAEAAMGEVVEVIDKYEMDSSVGFAPLYTGEKEIFDEEELRMQEIEKLEDEIAVEDTVFSLEPVAIAGASTVEDILRFHMSNAAVDGVQLFQTFRKDQEQKKRIKAQAERDTEVLIEAEVAKGEKSASPLLRAAAKSPATLAAIKMKTGSILSKIRRKHADEGKSDIAAQDDLDVERLIDVYSKGGSAAPPEPLKAKEATESQLAAIQATLSGQQGTNEVDAILNHHLSGKFGEPLPSLEDETEEFEKDPGTILEAARRRKHRQLRKLRSTEAMVVEGLLQTHQGGLDLARMEEELDALPDFGTELLLHEAAMPPSTSKDAAGSNNATTQRALTRMKEIVATSSVLGTLGRSAAKTKSEAELLINAHMYGEELDHLETIDERLLRRQKELEARRHLKEKSEVDSLMAAFDSPEESKRMPILKTEAETRAEEASLKATELLEAFIDTGAPPKHMLDDLPLVGGKHTDVEADTLLAHFSAQTTASNRELKQKAKQSEVDEIIGLHLEQQKAKSEVETDVEAVLEAQLLQHDEDQKRRNEEKRRTEAEAAEVQQLMEAIDEEQRQQELEQNNFEQDVDDVLAFFNGGKHSETPRKLKKKLKKRTHGKRDKSLKHLVPGFPDDVESETDDRIPSIHVESIDDRASMKQSGVSDVFHQPAVPKIGDMSPYHSDVSTIDATHEILATTWLQPSPFANRRLALETPRTSPSATPRVQRYVDVSDGSSSAASPLFERHFVQSSVELLPDMEAATPQPNPHEVALPKVEDWVITRSHDDDENVSTTQDDRIRKLTDDLVQEDVQVALQAIGDNIDIQSVAFEDEATARPLDSAQSQRSRQVASAGGISLGSFQFDGTMSGSTAVATFFASDDDDDAASSASFSSAGKKSKRKNGLKRGNSMKFVRTAAKGNSFRSKLLSTSDAPLTNPEDDYLALHTAATLSEVDDRGAPKKPLRVASAVRLNEVKKVTKETVIAIDSSEKKSSVRSFGDITPPSMSPSLSSLGADETSPPKPISGEVHKDDDLSSHNSSLLSLDSRFERHCSEVRIAALPDDRVYVALPITTFHLWTSAGLVSLILCALIALYYVLAAVSGSSMCRDGANPRWEVLLAILLIDVVVVEPIVLCCAYAYRYLTSDERTSIWRELHPYDGEKRNVLLPPLRAKYKKFNTICSAASDGRQSSTGSPHGAKQGRDRVHVIDGKVLYEESVSEFDRSSSTVSSKLDAAELADFFFHSAPRTNRV